MKRGDVVIAVMKGDYGKPRPAVVVQADRFLNHSSLTVAMTTTTLSELDDIRLTLTPSAGNGLRETSQVLMDRLQTVPMARIKDVIGELDREQMARIDRGITLFLGLA